MFTAAGTVTVTIMIEARREINEENGNWRPEPDREMAVVPQLCPVDNYQVITNLIIFKKSQKST